uniref:Uncharacterized protein n=1 Tax=Globodera pallida TaxID=36090 RepID=A0A183CF79_GLOPA
MASRCYAAEAFRPLPRVDTPAPCKMGTNGARNSHEYANSSGSSVDSDEVVRVAAGHKEEELLRRVRRLQAELSRRDAELARLREMLPNGEQRRARGGGVSQGRRQCGKRRGLGNFGARPLRKKWSLDRDGHISLPVVGSRIQPKAHADRFTRPNASQSNHRLCQLRLQQQQQQNNNYPKAPNGVTLLRGRSLSASRLISVADCAAKVQPRVDTPAPCKMGTNGARNSHEYANSSGSSVDSDEVVRVAAGHKEEELLRRVRRLQAELSRRDAELARLREMLPNGSSGVHAEAA